MQSFEITQAKCKDSLRRREKHSEQKNDVNVERIGVVETQEVWKY